MFLSLLQNVLIASSLATSQSITTRGSAVSLTWLSARRATMSATMKPRCSGGETSKLRLILWYRQLLIGPSNEITSWPSLHNYIPVDVLFTTRFLFPLSTLLSLSPYNSKVDQEIVRILQERMRACTQREGDSYHQNCSKELQNYNDATKAFLSRCK